MRRLCTAIVGFLLAVPTMARLPQAAPALPPPSPAVFTIVNVDTAQELADACWTLTSNRAILIAPGVYNLATVSFPNGVDGRLTVGRFGAQPISNIQIRGTTGDPEDVVILGAGMLNPIVPYGFQVFTATDVWIADLSIGSVYFHAIGIQGDQGAKRVHLHHVRAFDAGQQIVKGSGSGANDVTIEWSEIFYTAGAIVHPEGSPPNSCYTNGIDALGVSGWIVRDNFIHDIWCQNNTLAGPAILLWGGSSGTLVERNLLLDCARGPHLGLGPGDHTGGIVRNNVIRWDPAASYDVDVGIYTVSPGSKVLHNTVLTRGNYPNAIEVRYGATTGVEVRNNLLDAAVMPREGATPTMSNNVTSAVVSWFVGEATGNLHLTTAATPAIDEVSRLADALDEFDAWTRSAVAGSIDIGAAEYEHLFRDDFESGSTGVWSGAQP